ncbi:MAG: hypothetical protein AAF764_06880 [Pseudomonadota bacterium]
MTDEELDDAILAAHAVSDADRLAQLYSDAAQRKQKEGDGKAYGFLLVQAYVFALESGSPLANDLHARLKRMGREA